MKLKFPYCKGLDLNYKIKVLILLRIMKFKFLYCKGLDLNYKIKVLILLRRLNIEI